MALANLPRPDVSVSDAINVFQSKGLNTFDMVVLMGTCWYLS
jgi:Peroxidase